VQRLAFNGHFAGKSALFHGCWAVSGTRLK
jgi:hypothetical protein